VYEIVSIKLAPSDDQSHFHADLVGYVSKHIPEEPVMVPPERIIQRMVLGEKFVVTVDGDPVEVSAGKCLKCGLEPYLKTSADTGDVNRIEQLPSI